ncbi:MAG: cupin domain-containing protein [Phycisphaerales bacterium]
MSGSHPKFVTTGTATRLTILGDAVFVRLTGADTNGALAVFEQHANPGGGVPTHLHEREDELFHVLAGSARFIVAGAEIIAPVGSTVWGPRGIAHSWEVVGNSPAKLLIAVTPAGMEHMFAELDKLPPRPPDFAKVAAICARFGVKFG